MRNNCNLYVYIYAVAAALAVLDDTVTNFVRSDS